MYFEPFASRLSASPPRDASTDFRVAAREVTSDAYSRALGMWVLYAQTQQIYTQMQWNEWMGVSVPAKELVCNFSIEENIRAGKIPATKVASEILTNFPFCRVWSFDRVGKKPDDPTFLIVAPYSGTDARIMSDAVSAFLPIGNVRLIEQRDRHHVPFNHTNGLDDSTGALIEVARRNPNCHIVSFSQSGIPATVSTAWMFQNPEFRGREPASLTVIGSPINAQLDPAAIDKMAVNTVGDPPYVMVGPSYRGAGAFVFPGAVSKLFLQAKQPRKIPGDATNQSLPAEHIHDTLQRVFREFWLAKGIYKFKGNLVDTRAIACPVLTFAGARDEVCPPAQVHDLHRLTPSAAAHVRLTLSGADHYDLVEHATLTKEIVPIVRETVMDRRVALPAPPLVA